VEVSLAVSHRVYTSDGLSIAVDNFQQIISVFVPAKVEIRFRSRDYLVFLRVSVFLVGALKTRDWKTRE